MESCATRHEPGPVDIYGSLSSLRLAVTFILASTPMMQPAGKPEVCEWITPAFLSCLPVAAIQSQPTSMPTLSGAAQPMKGLIS